MNKKSQLRVMYVTGPGNIIGTYQYWLKGEDDPTQVSIARSGLFYDLCKKLNLQGYLISSINEKKIYQDEQFVIEHRPHPAYKYRGIGYYIATIHYGIGLLATAIRFQADAIVLADGLTQWFFASLFPLFNIQVIPSIHCVMWHKFQPLSQTQKLILKLNRRFFSKDCLAVLAVSNQIKLQLQEMTNKQNRPVKVFIPTYRREQFAGIKDFEAKKPPFRFLFAGRIVPNKGVFELLNIAKRLKEKGRKDIIFDICGVGESLEHLRQKAKEEALESYFICHGYCHKPKMRELLGKAHVIIVPTRKDFAEGFNKVVAEGILASKPVITSEVCPAVENLKDAIILVPPDDFQAYEDAIIKLCDDPNLYEDKYRNCEKLQEQFYDESNSWSYKLESILEKLLERSEPELH